MPPGFRVTLSGPLIARSVYGEWERMRSPSPTEVIRIEIVPKWAPPQSQALPVCQGSAQWQIVAGISAGMESAGLGRAQRIRGLKWSKTLVPHVCSTLHQLRMTSLAALDTSIWRDVHTTGFQGWVFLDCNLKPPGSLLLFAPYYSSFCLELYRRQRRL